jgi:hypothetical protein
VNDQKIEVAAKINYLRAMFDSSGGWESQSRR